LYNILKEFGVPIKLTTLIKVCLNETYSKFRIGNSYLPERFPIQNGLKQGDALSPLPLNFSFEYSYVIRKFQESHVRLKLNATHQLLAYSDDVNLMGDNIDSI
jgi:hypothetical protein